MEVFLIIIICLLVGIVGISGYWIRKTQKRNKELEDISNRLYDRLGDIEQAKMQLKRMTERNGELEARIEVAAEELNRSKELQRNGELLLQEKMKTISELEARSKKLVEEGDAKNEERRAAEGELIELSGKKEILMQEVADLTEKLALLKDTHSAALRESRGKDRDAEGLKLDGKGSRLVELIGRIEEDYPELRGDLEGIAWKKVWLPKMQELVKKVGAEVSGIYKLTLKENEELVYIGQAVNIKERRYQHAKKLLGVLNKGNEKLYGGDWRPDDFWWEILEVGSGKEWLDSHERYWIDFFDATSGLNKK